MASPSARVGVACLIAALTVLAYQHRFIQDDAFISFRYAEHLAHGQGLTWNRGERVEGFTNLLWTLLLSLFIRGGVDPLAAATFMGLASFVGTLSCTYALGRGLGAPRWAAALAVLLLGTHYSFSAYATGGLETQSQALCFTGAALLFVRLQHATSERRLAALSFVLAVSIWTRLDSLLLAIPLGGVAVRDLVGRHDDRRFRAHALSLALPFVVLVGALATFKLWYFGEILPNTFYAKAQAAPWRAIDRGLHFAWYFVRDYSLLPMLVLIGVHATRRELRDRSLVTIASVIALWFVYLLKTGADFMEYRFVMPVLPLLFALAARALAEVGPAVPWAAAAMASEIMVSSIGFAERSRRDAFLDALGTESIPGLEAHVLDPREGWQDIGRTLAALFPGDTEVTIAVMASGAIPYRSGLRTIDMLGLNDRWIARHGVIIGDRPGHQRRPTLAYLLEQKVNLVVHPWAVGDPEERITRYTEDDLGRYVPLDSRVAWQRPPSIVELPIQGAPGRKLRVLYLVPSPPVDALIETRALRTFDFGPAR